MTAGARFEEPTLPALPPKVRRPLAAVWISLTLHAAVIALVQVVPPSAIAPGETVIEARLLPLPARPSAEASKPELAVPVPPAPEAPRPALVPAPMPGETALPAPAAKPVQPEPPSPPAPVAAPAPTPAPVPVPVPVPPPPEPPAPLATLTSSVDLNYYSARELDVQPRALRRIQPDYPLEADRAHVSGNVRLLLRLEADGRVSDVEVVSATPPDVFDDSARKAFAAARFSPALKSGKPVRARVLIEVEYDWAGRR